MDRACELVSDRLWPAAVFNLVYTVPAHDRKDETGYPLACAVRRVDCAVGGCPRVAECQTNRGQRAVALTFKRGRRSAA